MEIHTLKCLDELTENDYPNVIKVNLSNLGLTEVPEKIYNLVNLRILNLSSNQIVKVSNIFETLPSLQKLYLSENLKNNISIIYKYKGLKYITECLNYVELTKISNYDHFRYLNNFLDYNKSFQSVILCLLIQSDLCYELIYLILDLLLQKLYNF